MSSRDQASQLWFAEGPQPKESHVGNGFSRSLAVVDGRAWLIERSSIHRAQQERPVEAAVMPHSFLNAAVYSLSTHGWEVPDALRALTVERDRPLDESVLPPAVAALVDVNGDWVLGFRYEVGGYNSLLTVYGDLWLYALCPHSEGLPVTLQVLPR